jgi:hypothetical protein
MSISCSSIVCTAFFKLLSATIAPLAYGRTLWILFAYLTHIPVLPSWWVKYSLIVFISQAFVLYISQKVLYIFNCLNILHA